MKNRPLTSAQYRWFTNPATKPDCPPLDSWCILVTTSHQFAPGVTGLEYNEYIYIDDNEQGYPYAAAAYKAAKESGIKNKHTKGKSSIYGNIGEKTITRTAVQIKDIPLL